MDNADPSSLLPIVPVSLVNSITYNVASRKGVLRLLQDADSDLLRQERLASISLDRQQTGLDVALQLTESKAHFDAHSSCSEAHPPPKKFFF